MDNQNKVDITSDLGYNEGTHANDEIIDLSGVPPLNDTECQHETLIPDPEDTIGTAVYHGCSNLKCARGWYIQPMQ